MDNDLNHREREALLIHLAGCNSCQTVLAELQGLFGDLESMPEMEAPGDLVARVMSQLPSRRARPQRLNLGSLVLAGQALIGLILLLLSWPVLALAMNQSVGRQVWEVLVDIVGSIQTGFMQLAADLNYGLQSVWQVHTNLIGFDLTPTFALAIMAGLILAWLVGNGLLLRGTSPSVSNGGTT